MQNSPRGYARGRMGRPAMSTLDKPGVSPDSVRSNFWFSFYFPRHSGECLCWAIQTSSRGTRARRVL
eukprot:7013584-Pyramimonas_sp.AAC.1